MIGFYFQATNTYGSVGHLDLESLFILTAITCYPIGVFYGWRDMIGLFKKITRGDRISRFRRIGTMTIAISIMYWSIGFAITICFGWIWGVKNAIQKLIKIKNS